MNLFCPKSSLVLILVAIVASGCNRNTSKPGKNPYEDDYSSITPISFKDSWGTANVHDPCIVKTDSFYYEIGRASCRERV